jgi:hypothetical protein
MQRQRVALRCVACALDLHSPSLPFPSLLFPSKHVEPHRLKPRSICISNTQTLSWMRVFLPLHLFEEGAKLAYETRAKLATIFEYEAA